ncbi:MAG: hypothetical protein ACI9OJ_002222, partial [Myxococcota bacterium]
PTVNNTMFFANRAEATGVYSGGGAVYTYNNSSPQFTNVWFVQNEVGPVAGTYRGGGAYFSFVNGYTPTPTLVAARFIGNSTGDAAHHYGGGGALMLLRTPLRVVNSIFVGNSTAGNGRGGAMYALFDGGFPRLTNVSMHSNVAANGGNAIYAFQTGNQQVTAYNTIIYGNGGGTSEIVGDAIAFSNSCAPGIPASGGNLPGCDPLFANPVGPDGIADTMDDALNVTATSVTIDQGQNGPVDMSGIATDIEGNQRVIGGTIDMGAYEHP